MSINYLLPNTVAGGITVKQFLGRIDASEWKNTASNPVLLYASPGIMIIPISFCLNVTTITNIGILQSYLIGTDTMRINGDAFMGIGSFLSGASPSFKNYTFYFNSGNIGNAIGEVSSNTVLDYDIYLYSPLNDSTLSIATTPYCLTYIEITF